MAIKIIKKSKYAILLSVIISTLFLFCAYSTGGSEIGNPVTVEGTVVDSKGNGVSGVKLYMIDPLQTNPQKIIPDSCYQTESESDGSYRFSGIQEGAYSLFGCDSTGQQMFLSKITINNAQSVNVNNENYILC